MALPRLSTFLEFRQSFQALYPRVDRRDDVATKLMALQMTMPWPSVSQALDDKGVPSCPYGRRAGEEQSHRWCCWSLRCLLEGESVACLLCDLDFHPWVGSGLPFIHGIAFPPGPISGLAFASTPYGIGVSQSNIPHMR